MQTIAIIDEDPSVQTALLIAFESEGYRVTIHSDGRKKPSCARNRGARYA
jgi:DNA-binding response OmpR family regulator